jgi:aminodeoxychorismate lyase
MISFLNGEFVPADRAVVSVLDRGFLYGDGLFETLLVSNARPFRWDQHWQRLEQGASFLGIEAPFPAQAARQAINRLIHENQTREALARITLSRGVGPRGYSPRGANSPTFAITLHSAPPAPDPTRPVRWKLQTASFRLNHQDLLAQFKTANKLAQVLARAEVEADGADEALLLNDRDQVVEAATGNLFWVEDGVVLTPPIEGILPGVTRQAVLELCAATGITTREDSPDLARLQHSDGVFISLSSFGVVPAESINGRPCRLSSCSDRLLADYLELVRRETA